MKTYNRICIKDYYHVVDTEDGERILELKRGREYETTEVYGDGDVMVMVFSNYWAFVPVHIFAGEILLTRE